MEKSTLKKIGVGVGVAAATVGLGYAAKKIFSGKKKKNTTQRLKARVMRKMLKIKDIQLSRKLFKEQLKGFV